MHADYRRELRAKPPLQEATSVPIPMFGTDAVFFIIAVTSDPIYYLFTLFNPFFQIRLHFFHWYNERCLRAISWNLISCASLLPVEQFTKHICVIAKGFYVPIKDSLVVCNDRLQHEV